MDVPSTHYFHHSLRRNLFVEFRGILNKDNTESVGNWSSFLWHRGFQREQYRPVSLGSPIRSVALLSLGSPNRATMGSENRATLAEAG